MVSGTMFAGVRVPSGALVVMSNKKILELLETRYDN